MIKTKENLLKTKSLLDKLRATTPDSDIFIGLILATFFVNILGFALPIAIRITYDLIIPYHAVQTLMVMSMGIVIAILLESLLRICRNYVSAWADARFEHLASIQALRHILEAKLSYYEKVGPAVYLDYLNSIHLLKNFFGGQAIVSLLDLPFVLLYLLFIFYLAGSLVTIPVIMLFIFAWLTYHYSQQMRVELDKKHQVDDKRINFIISVLTGIHTIKSMATEIPMKRRYERLQQNTSNTNYDFSLSMNKATVLASFARQSTLILVIAIGAIAVMKSNLSIGGLAACIILAGRILQPISHAIDVWSRLQDIKLAEERLEKLAQLPKENTIELPSFSTIKGDIELKNLSFRYNENLELFKDLNIQIKSGEFVSIKGDNLSGKSTLLWLMTGIITPSHGKILIDHKDIANFDSKTIRKQIAYLPQEGFLFNGTILENITMFRPELKDKAKIICDKLGLTNTIQRLPKGFDTAVGKYAVEALTPGLRQTVCIARGLIEEPKVILFDEANRHLDFEQDGRLKNLLIGYKHHATIILISSRPSLLELADTSYILQDKTLRKIKK